MAGGVRRRPRRSGGLLARGLAGGLSGFALGLGRLTFSPRLAACEDFYFAKARDDEFDRVTGLAALIFPRAGTDQQA